MQHLRALLDLPRRAQPAALRSLRARIDVPTGEAWNTRFGPLSLFDTWTRTSVMTSLYAANRRCLAAVLARRDFIVLEVGGGNGRLWEGLPPGARGEIVVVDPMADVAAEIRSILPAGVRLTACVGRVEEVELPPVDAAVCSLTLHHVAGADADERAAHGMTGPGKYEVLRQLQAAVRDRAGFVLLNEADVFCDLALAPGDPILEDRLMDSYVRRCARALLDDWDAAAPEVRLRLEAVIWRWCVDQVALSTASRADRDVYELDVPRWLALIARAGLTVEARDFTDPYGLFCQYALR